MEFVDKLNSLCWLYMKSSLIDVCVIILFFSTHRQTFVILLYLLSFFLTYFILFCLQTHDDIDSPFINIEMKNIEFFKTNSPMLLIAPQHSPTRNIWTFHLFISIVRRYFSVHFFLFHLNKSHVIIIIAIFGATKDT